MLIIMRGVSGSGKSTKARELAEEMSDSVICSADDFFMQDGKYNFDPSKLGQAHAACLAAATNALAAGVGVVIIDNTNTQKWEFEKYLAVATEHGHEVRFEVVGELSESALAVYAGRNAHGVPLNVIRKQARRFEQNPV